jgi:hypothetical protein
VRHYDNNNHLAVLTQGNDEVIELLVTKGRAKVDQVDTAGNTALLCAAKVGNVSTMSVLVDHGASIDAQNKVGETVWHYAIRQDDDTLLKAVAGLYRKAKQTDRGTKTIVFDEGRNPLQVWTLQEFFDCCKNHKRLSFTDHWFRPNGVGEFGGQPLEFE